MANSKFKIEPHEDGLSFKIESAGQVDLVIIPSELLDDEVGDNSSVYDRNLWVEENLPSILTAYKASTDGGFVTVPFNQVVVQRNI